MDLGVRRTEYGAPEDQSWLGSAHATDTADTVTLDLTGFAAFTDGVLPSGIVLAEVNADPGTLVHFTDGATQTVRGHLFTTKRVPDGATTIGAAMLWHGQVIVANLPANHGLNAAAAAALPQVDYVGEVPA